MAKYLLCFVMVLLLAGCAPITAAGAIGNQPPQNQLQANQSQANQSQGTTGQSSERAARTPRDVDPWLNSLWFDMSMGSQLVGIYNDFATERDMARADHVSLIDLLDKVDTGRRLVVFKNAADVEELVPRLADKIDIIGYNLESGPANRPDEQADPVGSIRRVRAIADQYGMQVAFGPDRSFALSHGVQMAPYADIFVLQVQRVQTEPQTVQEFVVPLVAQLRQANPDLQVSVQIRTEGNVADLGQLLISLKGSIDGVSILTNDETSAVADSLLSEIRVPIAEIPVTLPSPTPVKSDGSVGALPTATSAPRRTAIATPPPVEPYEPNVGSPVRSLLLTVGLTVMGIMISGVVATVLIYAFRSRRR